MGRGWLNALRPRTPEGDAADIERAVATGGSAALFLKRPKHLLEGRARGKIEGDHLIRALARGAAARGGRRAPRGEAHPARAAGLRVVAQRGDARHQRGRRGLRLERVARPGAFDRAVSRELATRHAPRRGARGPRRVPRAGRGRRRGGRRAGPSPHVHPCSAGLQRERRARILGPAKKPVDRQREEIVRSPKLQKVIADMAGAGAQEPARSSRPALLRLACCARWRQRWT